MSAPVPGRIPWEVMVAWCDFHDLPREDLDLLDRCVVALDTEFIAFQIAMASEKPVPWHQDQKDEEYPQ